MPLELAITIHNKNTEPMLLNIEPLGEDYTLLPGDTFEIWEETDHAKFKITPGYFDPSESRNVSYETNNMLTIYEYFEYQVRSKGVPILAGYQ